MKDLNLYSPSPAPSTTLEVFNAADTPEVWGTVAIPVRDQVKTPTVTSLIQSDFRYFAPRGVNRMFVQGSILTLQRNECIQRMRGEWILFVDDDMVWDADAIARLVQTRDEHDLDVVGGLCFRRTHPHQPTLYQRDDTDTQLYVTMEKWPEDELVEVDATGCAFLLVTVRALEKIAGGPMPPLDMRVGGPPPNFFRWEGIKGEDIRFCEDLRAAGNKIFVDTSIKVGHVSEMIIDERDFYRAIAERKPEVERETRKIYRKRDLPVLTAREAKAKIYGR